jgi:hypothetical protein
VGDGETGSSRLVELVPPPNADGVIEPEALATLALWTPAWYELDVSPRTGLENLAVFSAPTRMRP